MENVTRNGCSGSKLLVLFVSIFEIFAFLMLLTNTVSLNYLPFVITWGMLVFFKMIVALLSSIEFNLYSRTIFVLTAFLFWIFLVMKITEQF